MRTRFIVTMAVAALALHGEPVDARIPPELKCKDIKGKASGVQAFSLLKAFGANARKPNTKKLTQDLAKAGRKFTKAFTKIEAKNGCATTGDSGDIRASTDQFVANVLARLCPPVETSTTTTLFETTTTTTTMVSPSSTTTTTTTLPPATGGLVISEVLYDPSSSDNGFEWVELANTSAATIDLSTFSLGYGGAAYTSGIAQLSGAVVAGGVFVVGGPSSDATNGFPVYDQVLDLSPDLQNSGTIGDGVALFDLPASDIMTDTVPVDAVVYGGNNDNGLIDETGTANAPEVDDAPAGSSIERLNAAGSWQIQESPSPGTVPF
jgi:hypothetical protein